MSAAYLMHITTTTGHARRSYRDEVDDAVVTIVGQMLAEARSAGSAEIRPGYALSPVTAVGSALLATVRQDRLGPLVTIGVARKSRDAARLWSDLRAHGDAVGDPPRAPWCAAILYPAIEADLASLEWMADFERCLAWAWIERV